MHLFFEFKIAHVAALSFIHVVSNFYQPQSVINMLGLAMGIFAEIFKTYPG
jgi:hypothetical protein